MRRKRRQEQASAVGCLAAEEAPRALVARHAPNRVVADSSRRSVLAGVRLAVYEAGSGPAIVLPHGFPGLAYTWR